MGDGVPLWVTGRGKSQSDLTSPIGELPWSTPVTMNISSFLDCVWFFSYTGSLMLEHTCALPHLEKSYLTIKTHFKDSSPLFTLWAPPTPCPSPYPSLDHTGFCMSMSSLISSTRDSGRGEGGLPGWGVDGRRRPPLAIFLASFDILHLPAHGVPLHGEIIHPQVLVGCGRIQAEHERWGQADTGVTEMGKPRDTGRDRERQTVTKADHDRDREQKETKKQTKTKREKKRQMDKGLEMERYRDNRQKATKRRDREGWRGQNM